MGLLLTNDQLTLSACGLEFGVRLDSLPYPEVRLNNLIVGFRLKALADEWKRFVTQVLRRVPRYRQEMLELEVESPAKRNYLLFRLVRSVKRRASVVYEKRRTQLQS